MAGRDARSGQDPRAGWIRRHRRLALAFAAVVVVAAAVAPFALSIGPGYAAIVGSKQITVAALNAEIANLKTWVRKYPGTVQLSSVQETQQTLTWLIRFKINDELAKQAGITVSAAQAQAAWKEIYNDAKASAQAQGITNVTDNLILAANGIPPNMLAETSRYQSIDDQFAIKANKGEKPTTQAARTAATDALNKARCLAAEQLKIKVNPQYGRLDYSQYAIVAVSSTATRSAGTTPTASPIELTPAC